MRCNCETDYCDHSPGRCEREADGTVQMRYLGAVCGTCAIHIRANGGGQFLTEVKH